MNKKLLLIFSCFTVLLTLFLLTNKSPKNNNDNPVDSEIKMLPETLQKAQGRPKFEASKEEIAFIENRSKKKAAKVYSKSNTNSSSFANGQITGSWYNVPFSATGRWGFSFRTKNSVYDKENHTLYVVSHANHLWRINKGASSSEYVESEVSWSPMNIKQSFSGFLRGINPDKDSFRILWANSPTMKYSDDEGATWNTSSGLSFDSTSTQGAVAEFDGSNHVVMVGRKGSTYRPYYSTDSGLSFQLSNFSIPSTNNTIRIVQPHNTGFIYMLVRNSSTSRITIYNWDYDSNTFNLVQSPTSTFSGLNRVLSTYNDDNIHFYVATGSNIYYSGDEGATWTHTNSSNSGTGDVMPREVSPLNPNAIFSGYLDVRRSTNNGTSFGGTGHYLGWDVHHIKAYTKKDGTPFMFIGNDFGTSFSYTPETLSTYIKLNNKSTTMMSYDSDNSQHYKTFFNATQDRGTRGSTDKAGATGTNEIRSTDGLRVTLSGNEKGVWTWMYFGTIYHKDNFAIKSSDLKGINYTNTNWWASAMIASPDLSEDAVYIASSTNLTKLTFDRYANRIRRNSHHFDFSTLTSQPLTGFGYSPINTDRWYVSVRNGDIFYSEDGGLTFNKSSLSTKPRANDQSRNYYKNQHVIKGSRLDENKVFYAGVTSNGSSSGTKFMISNDGGKTFTNHSNGLNVWRVRSFDMSPDEKYIYAACANAGIWVYSVDEDKWYEMDDENVPQVDFSNVDYIVNDDVVRFSSYGNGTLNFTLDKKLKDISYPSNLKITSEASTSIDLEWIDNSNNETGFYVQKTRNDIDWETVATLEANSSSYTDIETTGSDYITYRIIAFNESEESNPSNYAVSLSRSPILLDKSGWELISTDSNRNDHPGTHAFDGNLGTYWFTDWNDGSAIHPHEIVIDMHETIDIKALGWYNRQDHPNGRVANYEFYATTDLNDWGTPVSKGTWTDTTDEIIESFPSTTARYLKFIALSATSSSSSKLTSCAEISVYKEVPLAEAPKPPYAPEILIASGTGENTGEISFIDASNNETGFYLEQLVDGTYQRVQTLNANSTIANITDLNPGTYYTFRLASYNEAGQSEYSKEVKILTSGTALSVNDIDSSDNFSVYPNPFQKNISISLKNNTIIDNISLFNIQGKKVFTRDFHSNESNLKSIELPSNLSKGIYILKIHSNKPTICKKIIKN